MIVNPETMIGDNFPFERWEDIPVGVYAIAHNEGKFVERWMESMAEADKIYVYENNNSEDDTYDKFKELADGKYKGKLILERGEVKPFRFDTARNQGMEMIPVWGEPDSVYALWCTDIDETLAPGWAEAYKKAIFNCKGRFQHILYKYSWNHDEFGNPGRVFWYDKTILNYGGWTWAGPVHEWQSFKKDSPELKASNVYIDDGSTIWLHHYPDNTKSRGSYLGLLELRVKENPDDCNARCYLVREYGYHNQWENSVKEGIFTYMDAQRKGQNFPDILTFLAKEIANGFNNVGLEKEAEFFYKRAIEHEPRLKDNYMYYAQFLAYHGRPFEALEQIRISKQKAVRLSDWRELDYMWSQWKESQIKADAYCWLGDYELAWKEINKGLNSMTSDKDRYEARGEGFFSDYDFIKNKLGITE